MRRVERVVTSVKGTRETMAIRSRPHSAQCLYGRGRAAPRRRWSVIVWRTIMSGPALLPSVQIRRATPGGCGVGRSLNPFFERIAGDIHHRFGLI
jgi:hypothetical protein